MKNFILLITFLTSMFSALNVDAQCYTATYLQWPTSAYTPTCNGSFANVTASGYASEYSIVNLVAGNTYSFRSSVQSDYITVDNNGSAPLLGVAGVSGANGITWVCSVSGAYRFYTHTNSSCGAQNTNRTRSVRCDAGAPSNDLVANATTILCGSTTSGTTLNATSTGTYEGTSSCGIAQSQPAVWYQVAGNGQTMTASLCATAWDSKISVYSGTATSLNCIGGNDDAGPSCIGTSSSFSFPTISGTAYWIKVYGFNSNSAFSLALTCNTPVPDPCASITSLTCGSASNYSLTGSTGAWNNFGGLWATPGDEQVFSYTATLTGVHTFYVTNTEGYVDFYYKASSCAGSIGWTYVDDIFGSASNNVTLNAGVTYYFLLDDENTIATTGTITITCPVPAPNPCNNLTNIASCGVSQNVNISAGDGVWSSFGGPWTTAGRENIFTYTPTVTASYPITVSNNSSGWIDLFVKSTASGCNNSGWTYIDDITGTFTNNVTLTAGTTYYFLLDDEDNLGSTGSISIGCPCIGLSVDGSYTYNGNFSISGSTTGACDNSALRVGDDLIYAVTVGCEGNYTFSTCGGAFWDTYLYLTTAASGGGIVLALNDDNCGGSLQSSLTATLSAGTYYLVVEGFSSTESGAFTLNVSGTGSGPSITGSASNATCFGASNGSITATVNGNGNTASATLNGASFNGSASGLAAGTYTVTATNCWGTSNQSFTVSQPTTLSASISSNVPNSTICSGGSVGLTASVSGGSGTVNYQWQYQDNGGNWINVTGTGWSGTAATPFTSVRNPSPTQTRSYRIVVTSTIDAQCSVIASEMITVVADPVFTITSNNVSCFGVSDGTATAVLTGGLPLNYGYNWSSNDGISTNNNPTGDGTLSVSGLSPTEWVVNTTVLGGSYGCYAESSVNISQPTVLTSASTSGSITCNGGTTTVTVSANGGTAPYSGTGTFTVAAGNYSYTVTDANGCTSTTSGSVSQPTVLVSSNTHGSIACNGGTTTVSVSANGGTAPYSGTGTFTVSAGNYSYTVTDANGCTSTTSGSITQPGLLQAHAANTPILCNGGTTIIGVTFSGGTGVITGIGNYTVTAGTYSYTINDSNGCTATTTITVTEPTLLTASLTTSNYNGYGVSCFGSNDGSVTSAVNGGIAPYGYIWNNGATAANISNLTDGTYNVLVFDANGCSVSANANVTEPTVLTSASTSGSIACNGGTTTVSVSAAGGTAPYSGDGNYTVGAGTYSYTVTDANGCTSTTSITVSEPTVLTSASTSGSIACNGGTTAVSVIATGGTAPYSGDGNYTVGAGTYSYTVTDANGCTSTTSITVSEPTVLTSASTSGSIACNGGTTTVSVIATGGTAPYSGDGNYTVGAGTYSYTVTDANGCTSTTSITVSEPTVLTSASTIGSIACNGGTTTVSVSAAGGTAPYSGTGTFTVSAGNYSFTVTDANGCTSTTTGSISQPTAVETTVGEGQTVFYGYAPMACATISGSATGGTPGYTYNWSSNGTTNGTTTSLTVCPTQSTTYTLTATDALGCTSSSDVYICVVDVRCYAGNSNKQKVQMCQTPPGNPANAHTICVDASAVPAHLAIGCVLGACGELATACPTNRSLTQIVEENVSAAFTVYPNPTMDRTSVSLTVANAGEYNVVLYNTMGQVVNNIYNGSIAEYENQTFDLNMTSLEFGIYILSVSNGDGTIETVRVVKQ